MDVGSSHRQGHDKLPQSDHASSSPDGGNVSTGDSIATTRLWEEEQLQLEREWYQMDEGGRDETSLFGMTEKQVVKFKEQSRWEENQLRVSGVLGIGDMTSIQLDEDDTSGRLHVLVRDVKPRFLLDYDVRNVVAQDIVSVVRDPSSDMAVLARKGSQLLKRLREENDRANRERFWEVGGSKMGNLIGVKKEIVTEDQQESGDYRKRSQFSGVLIDRGAEEAVSDFAKTKTIKQQRQFLPIFAVRDQLMRDIRDNQVIVIVGKTGSGKTTQLAQYLYEDKFASGGLIVCTQPRRVAAVSVARRVAEEMECNLGSTVGYAIRFDSCVSKQTAIKYCTEGILVREYMSDPLLSSLSVIIMDEAHERSLNTDVLFGILKLVLRRRLDLKLIVTSATLDSSKFANFFGSCPVIEIPGRTFPVETHHLKVPCEDYVEAAIKQILTIHVSHGEGDLLVFMTGQEDIEAICVLLAEKIAKNSQHFAPLRILPIYSLLPSDLQAQIFEKAPPGTRKCIVATNIAETSLTVDGIKYVIDCGFAKVKVYNPRIGIDSLQVSPVSQANANQRAGRAGRTSAGHAYRMYTQRAYNNELLTTSVPEVQRTNLASIVLLLKSLKIHNVMEFDFMDAPPTETLKSAMFQLWLLGALDANGQITRLGNQCALFPLDPPLSKLLIEGCALGCSSEVLTIVAALTVPTIFFRPPGRESESDSAREKFFVPESDHLTLLHVYQQWTMNHCSARWCTEHFVHVKALMRVRDIRSQLVDIMKSENLPIESCGTDWDVVRKALCCAFFHNTARIKGIGTYVNIRSGTPCLLHPTSALYGLGYTPDYVIYHELVCISLRSIKN